MNIKKKDKEILVVLNIIFILGFGFVYLNEKLNNFERIFILFTDSKVLTNSRTLVPKPVPKLSLIILFLFLNKYSNASKCPSAKSRI